MKNPWSMRLIFFVGISSLLVLLLSINGSARVFTVDDNEGEDFSIIQDAIDAAEDGDIIRVFEGTYYENVVVNKSVSLIGNGSELTTIDGGDYGDVVAITADEVKISRFTITESGWYKSGINIESNKSTIEGNNCSNNWWGIRLFSSSNSNITNNICSNNDKGIYLQNSTNSTLKGNNCSNNWWGIHLLESSNFNITNNYCSNSNFGISLDSSSDCTITDNNCTYITNSAIDLRDSSNCTIETNNCSQNKFGINLMDSSNCTIKNNICSASNWYGIFLQESSDNNTISGNNCLKNRMGISILESSNTIIMNNTCSLNSDYGIYLGSSSNCTITHNIISENRVGIRLRSSSRDNTIHYNFIFLNTAYGINATGNKDFNVGATYNWWGDASGPNHPENNSMGKGDDVTDYIDFNPWIDEDGNLFFPSDEPDDDSNDNQLLRYILILLLSALLGILAVFIIGTNNK